MRVTAEADTQEDKLQSVEAKDADKPLRSHEMYMFFFFCVGRDAHANSKVHCNHLQGFDRPSAATTNGSCCAIFYLGTVRSSVLRAVYPQMRMLARGLIHVGARVRHVLVRNACRSTALCGFQDTKISGPRRLRRVQAVKDAPTQTRPRYETRADAMVHE